MKIDLHLGYVNDIGEETKRSATFEPAKNDMLRLE
jgi:hypothetical protein